MADFGSPVAANTDPSVGLKTLSALLGIKQQQQALQLGAAQVQQEQQTAGQRSKLASFYQSFDPTKHVGPDGTLDLDSVLTDPQLRESAGDAFPQVIQQMIAAKSGQLQAKQQLANLNDSIRTQFQGLMGGLRTDPDVLAGNDQGFLKARRAMGEFAVTSNDAARIAAIYGNTLENVPKEPAEKGKPSKLAQALSNFQLQAMDAGTQSGRQAPTYLNTGPAAVQTNPQAAGGGQGSSIQMGIPPGWQQYEDPVTHAQYIRNLQTGESRPIGSTYGGQAPAPSAPAAPRAAPAAAPPNYKAGEADTIKANTLSGGQRYNDLVNASVGSQDRINVLDNIIRLAPQTRTGPGSGWKAAAETAIGQTDGFKGAGTDAAKYNELVKYMHQNALKAWGAAGGTGTDSQLHTIESGNPNTSQDPATIVELAKFNKAGELAMQAKATAHQTWMHQAGNNFSNQSDFENQWRQHFDPLLFQLKTWDAKDAAARLKELPQAKLDELASKQAWLKSEGVY